MSIDPLPWADWISEDIVQRLYSLRQDLAEVDLDETFRQALRAELSVLVAELRQLSTELRAGRDVHATPPPDLLELLRSVSGTLRDRSALRRAGAPEHTRYTTRPAEDTPRTPHRPDRSRASPLDPTPRADALRRLAVVLADVAASPRPSPSDLELIALLHGDLNRHLDEYSDRRYPDADEPHLRTVEEVLRTANDPRSS